MIDIDGFRPNVGFIITNVHGQLFWARRVNGQDAWQFPQGGIKDGEDAEVALFRELTEEVGLSPADVQILDVTRGWLRYRLPKKLIRNQEPVCIGQKQKWYLLQLAAGDEVINLNAGISPEFDQWQWVSYWYPMSKVVSFKREVYRRALKELLPAYNQFVIQHSSPERSTC